MHQGLAGGKRMTADGRTAGTRGDGGATAWWSTRGFAALLVAATALPLLWPAVSPLIDLPGHMASYHVSLDLARSPALRRYFDFHWHLIGNLGVDLLILPLAPVLGLEPATKLVMLLIPTMTAAGFLLAARRAHGVLPPTAAFAVPLAYNYAFVFGFVNYSLAAGLAVAAFPWWMACTDHDQWRRRAIGFALIAPVVWIAHAIGWIVLGILCGTYALRHELARRRPVARALLQTALACLPLATPLVLMALSWKQEHGFMSAFFQWSELAKWIAMLFRDRWIALDLLSLLVAAAIGLLATTRVAGFRLEPRLAWPAAALFAVYLVAPQTINDSAFVGARILPYAAAYALLAIDVSVTRPMARAWAARAALAFLVVRIGSTTVSFLLYDRAWTAEVAAIDHIRPGSAVASFSRVPCKNGFENWYNPRLYHVADMAVVRRDAYVNATWGIPGLHLLNVRDDAVGRFKGDPSQMVFLEPCAGGVGFDYDESLRALPHDAFDYLWLIHIRRDRWPSDPRLTPVWSQDDSVLYRITRRPAA